MRPRLDPGRFGVAAPAGSVLAVGMLLLLSWIITPSSPLATPDNRVVLNLAAWPTPSAPKTITAPPAPPPPTRAVKRVRPKIPSDSQPTPPKTSEAATPTSPAITPVDVSSPSTTAIATTAPPETKDPVLTPVPIFELTALPRFIHQVQPHFPESMRHLGREGVVELDALIDSTGTVREVTIVLSAGPEFDQAAQAAILACAFAPGEVNGKPVTTLLRLPVKFRLQ